jgi:hypothetical protein
MRPSQHQFIKFISELLPSESVCLEVGVLRGDFSKGILEYVKPKKLFLIDPWGEEDGKNDTLRYSTGASPIKSNEETLSFVQGRFSNEINEGAVVLKRGFSENLIKTFPNNYFDFIYIDASHLYESVKADLEIALPKLRKNGFLCGDDYTFWATEEKGFGVVRAVDEFIRENNVEWFTKPTGEGDDLFDPNDNMATQWALKKKL